MPYFPPGAQVSNAAGKWSNIVAAREVAHSQHVEWSADHIECSVTLQCDWNDRHVLMLDMLGFADASNMVNADGDPLTGTGDLTANAGDPADYAPHGWPDLIDAADFTNSGTIHIGKPPICYSASMSMVKGIPITDTTGQGQDYQLAEIVFKFSTAQEVQLVSESFEFNSEMVIVDWKSLSWWSPELGDSSMQAITQDEAPGKIFHGMTYTKTFYRQPWIKQSLLWLPGCVNDRPLYCDFLTTTATAPYTGTGDTGGVYYDPTLIDGSPVGNVNIGYNIVNANSNGLMVFQPETLLCLPAHLARTTSVTGNQGYNITLKFAYKPLGWNRYFVSRLGGNAYFYPTANNNTNARNINSSKELAQMAICQDSNDATSGIGIPGTGYSPSASYPYYPEAIGRISTPPFDGYYKRPFRAYPIADFRDWIQGVTNDSLDAT